MTISFTAYGKPQPQGSSRAFIVAGKARITSANANLKPWRSEITGAACHAMAAAGLTMPMAGKHVPVHVYAHFTFRRPASVPKKRIEMVVKPDLDKLLRSVLDSCKGVLWHDDAQVVQAMPTKGYGLVEGVCITATTYGGSDDSK